MKTTDMLKLVALSDFPVFFFYLPNLEFTGYIDHICLIKGSIKELAIKIYQSELCNSIWKKLK